MHIRLIFRNRRRIKARGHLESEQAGSWFTRSQGTEIQVRKCSWTRARKALCIFKMPVPQTDTGRQEEDSKANGRRVVKELGKLTP